MRRRRFVKVEVQIRDLDQTVIGNPVHDIIRLGLSLATAARGSSLSSLMIVHMVEALAAGYESAFETTTRRKTHTPERPEPVHLAMKMAVRRSWQHLAEERIEDRTDDSAWQAILAAHAPGVQGYRYTFS